MNLAGVNTKALDQLTEEAFLYFEEIAEIHNAHGRQVQAEVIKEHVQVLRERFRRLENTVKALK